MNYLFKRGDVVKRLAEKETGNLGRPTRHWADFRKLYPYEQQFIVQDDVYHGDYIKFSDAPFGKYLDASCFELASVPSLDELM